MEDTRYMDANIRIEEAANAVKQIFVANAPNPRTGAQRRNIRVEYVEGGFMVVCDIYYMAYTTEKWGYNSWWKKTLTNPNEGWWEDAWEKALKFLSSVYGKEFRRVA